PWLVVAGRLAPIAPGALRGVVTGRHRSGSTLTVSGRLNGDGLAVGSHIVLLRADGSLAVDRPLAPLAVRTEPADGAARSRPRPFRIRTRIVPGLLPVRVLARNREIASELTVPASRPRPGAAAPPR